jgi:hypothetical protein
MPANTSYGLSAYSLALTRTGKFLVAGYSLTTSTPDFALACLNSNGTLDVTFGVNGKVFTSFGSG